MKKQIVADVVDYMNIYECRTTKTAYKKMKMVRAKFGIAPKAPTFRYHLSILFSCPEELNKKLDDCRKP